MINTLKRAVGLPLIFITLGSGCAHKDWYEHSRQQQIAECNRLPSGSQLEECEASMLPEYNDYKCQRDELLNEKHHD